MNYPNSKVYLSYQEHSKVLHFSYNEVAFFVDGVMYFFKSPLYATTLYIIAKKFPDTCLISDISLHLNKCGAFNSSSEAIVHKYTHGLRRDLKIAGIEASVIKNIRSLGYRLNEGWQVESHPIKPAIEVDLPELVELKSLVNKCIKYVNESSLNTGQAGMMHLEVDKNLVLQNMATLHKISWQIMERLDHLNKLAEIVDIKTYIDKLLSYVVFWRFGHRISTDHWKSDYVMELNSLYKNIEDKVRLAVGYSLQKL